MTDDELASLMNLRVAMLTAASAETAYDPGQYEQDKETSRLSGHCAAAAHVIQQKFGGDIIAGRVDKVPHYWNLLPDGSEVDLTSDQFGGNGIDPITTGRKTPRRKTVNSRFKVFARRVDQFLH